MQVAEEVFALFRVSTERTTRRTGLISDLISSPFDKSCHRGPATQRKTETKFMSLTVPLAPLPPRARAGELT